MEVMVSTMRDKGIKQMELISSCLRLLEMYAQRHPPVQADVDPEKKTIVVLGSGWASTSFLKDIDTDEYNVVKYGCGCLSRKR